MDMDKWFSALTQIAPVAMALAGVPPPMIPLATHAMLVVQHMIDTPGADKKVAALDLIKTGAQETNAAVGHTLINPDDLQGVVSVGIDNTIKGIHLFTGTPTPATPVPVMTPATLSGPPVV
jgi:hypothetical protein